MGPLVGVSVVVPVYNSADTLGVLLRRLTAVLVSLGRPYELILVNDGSTDSSWETICDLRMHYHHLRGINLMRNYGQHNALLCGVQEAVYDVIVTLDDDLQNPPEEIPVLLQKLATGYDVVYGIPQREQHGVWRDLASRMTKLALQSAMGAETARNVSAFRVFRTQLRDAFARYQSPFVSIDVLLTWGTTRFTAVPVQHDPRRVGTSNYTFRKLVTHALSMMTGFSTLPLQLASLVGFTFTVFGLLVLLYVLGRYALLGGSVPGFPFLASVIAIFSGAQMFALGIIGEYLARMHVRMMERPVYTVRAHTASRTDPVELVSESTLTQIHLREEIRFPFSQQRG
ncbi:MAG TPA: glycosyltransferase family 2 protein [Thermomicrobiales bacterium]|jgi:undecaprenyl-phosphate 4-deoxy-4-formamido-L-arabinose transferase